MKIKVCKKNTHGYVTLIVVIMFIPFLLLQGINLVNMSLDIVNTSSNTVSSNNQYIEEQTCWEEVSFFILNSNGANILGERVVEFSDTTCSFFIEGLPMEEDKYKISLESHRYDFFSSSEKYIFYDEEVLRFITLQ